jgi:uncharacterized membrane-anchored protein YitT (DUF2179 family)
MSTKFVFKKEKLFTDIQRCLLTILFTSIYGISVAWFLEFSEVPLYAGGIPGIGQLIRDFLTIVFHLNVPNSFLGIWVLMANVPLLILGWFGISKRFAFYTLISVLVQSTVLGFIPRIDIGTLAQDTLTLAIVGGALSGIGVGGALKFGSSTGGFDILSQYISLKKKFSVGFIVTILNGILAILGGLLMLAAGKSDLAFKVIAYTLIRIIITNLVLDGIHTSYQYLSVQIISSHYEEISKVILNEIHRGVTLINSQGAFSKQTTYTCMVVIIGYELKRLRKILNTIDPSAFVVVTKVSKVSGNFTQKTIS